MCFLYGIHNVSGMCPDYLNEVFEIAPDTSIILYYRLLKQLLDKTHFHTLVLYCKIKPQNLSKRLPV